MGTTEVMVMSDERQRTDEPELIGIIISQGARTQAPPRFAAYIWGAAPSDAQNSNSSTRAA
jgi:hypothetical protein